MRKYMALGLIFLLVMGIFSGCGQKEEDTLTIGLLPIVDALPLLVARDNGYFEEVAVDVELVFFQSALDRDSAFQAGSLDGAVGDLLAAALLEQSIGVTVIATILGVSADEGAFAILAAPDSDIHTVEDLKGVPIGISPNSIIEYTTDKMLLAEGFSQDDIEKTVVINISQRMEMLLSGQLQAANLPDPLATLAETKGARKIIDDTQGENISQTVLIMTDKAVDTKASQIEKLMEAYVMAIRDIQENPEAYRGLLEEELRLPEGLSEFEIDSFSYPQVPTEAEIEAVISWMLDKDILKNTIKYEELINESFIP